MVFPAVGRRRIELTFWLKRKSNLIAQNELLLLRHYRQAIAIARKGVPYDWAKVSQLEEAWNKMVDRPSQSALLLGGIRVHLESERRCCYGKV